MSSTFTQRVAAELRAEAARKQVTQMAVAASVGRPQTTVSRWLSGTTPLTVDAIEALCEALGISVGDLIARASAVREGGGMTPNGVCVPSQRPSANAQVRAGVSVAA